MILKTRVFILKEDLSKMSEAEKEKYQAKKDYLGDKLEDKDIVYSPQETDAVIDTKEHYLYIDMGEGKIRLRPLLGTDLVETADETPDYMFPVITFTGDINEIYEQLKKENK